MPPNHSPDEPSSGETKRQSRRRKTAHLKLVPETKDQRGALRERCFQAAEKLDRSRTPSKDELETMARTVLKEADLPEGYIGWTMVMLTSAFWEDQLSAIPPSRRLFLLPHCLKHAEGCPADYDQFGLDCKTCGACSIADFRGLAEEMGYKVLVAEGSPVVLKIIVSGHVDAVVGVACLNVLEKAFDKLLLAGIPCMAVPLLSSDCRNTSVDEDWVDQMIRVEQTESVQQTSSYLHLMRASVAMFEPTELERIAPRLRGGPRLAEMNGQGVAGLNPVAATEALAYDFMSKGGKHSRPFITLAVYDALTGGNCTQADGAQHVAEISDSVKRAAMSIETFHKASLVHDDIEDDDEFRYGDPTMHRVHGIPTAINVGDYMIGLGYRLVSRESKTLTSEVVADILDGLADAHMRLSEGQGAELIWRDSHNKQLTALDALKIYALKTSPAFEAALTTGVRLAGPIGEYAEPIRQFARHLGVAFQVLNDLNDWQGDDFNKMSAGGDVLGGRPTLLWALALESLPATDCEELMSLIDDDGRSEELRVARVRQLYQQADVFEKASTLVDRYQTRAEQVADKIEPEELRKLFYYLIDTVLERSAEPAPILVPTPNIATHTNPTR